MEVFLFNSVSYNSFIYKWINIENGKYYIGSHKGSIDDGYVGSGIDFKKDYLENRNIFKREILEFLLVEEYKKIREVEEKYLKYFDVENDFNSYNRTNCSYGGYHEKSMLERKNTFIDGRNLFQIYSDKMVETRMKKGSYKTSKIKEYETKNNNGSMEGIKKKISLANKNRIFIHLEEEEKSIKEEELNDFLELGWKLGHKEGRVYKTSSERKGKKMVIKEGIFKCIDVEELEEHFNLGWEVFSSNKGTKIMNNGEIQKCISIDKIEDMKELGWVFGRIKPVS